MERKQFLRKKPAVDAKKPTLISKASKNEIGSSFMHKGIWAIIFSYIGLNRELMRLRELNKKWKNNVEFSFEIIIKNSKCSIDRQLEDIYKDLESQHRAELDIALQNRKEYEQFLPLIPQKWAPYARISDLALLIKPPLILKGTISSILNLLLSETEFQKRKAIDWKFCQEMLKKKDLMNVLACTVPESLDEDKVRRFELQFNSIHNVNLLWVQTESKAIGYMLEWSLKLIEVYKNEKNLSREVRERVRKLSGVKKEQVNIERFTKIHNNILKLLQANSEKVFT